MLKKCVSVALAILMMNLSAFASSTLERGKAMSVRITSQISSNDVGSPSAIVDNDVKDRDGRVLIKRGTPVMLKVENKKARGCGRAGYVTVKCVSTLAVDGQNIILEGSVSESGEDKKGVSPKTRLGFMLVSCKRRIFVA